MGNVTNIVVVSGYEEDRKRILAALSEQNDFFIAGTEKDEIGAIIKSAQLKPDALILDLKQPEIKAPELAPMIHRRSPATAIVLLSNNDEHNHACRAFLAGISGYLLKDKDMDKLIPVLKIVISGGYFINDSVAIRIFNAVSFYGKFPGQLRDYSNSWIEQKEDYFSPLERGIVTLVAKGFSDREIAEYLNVSSGTIRNYFTAIKHRTKLKNRIQIVIFSLVYGHINLDHLNIIEDEVFSKTSSMIDIFKMIK
ncbi:MAG: response regulator transcription factor [Treponema sp.]|jgi:two-component system response regulator NreC|nr:response regulator transcription factor [Treponema sp.]